MTDAPPKHSHAVSLLATALLLALWLFLTLGSGWLAPRVAAVAEIIEVGLGFDVLPGRASDKKARRKDNG